MCPSNGRLSIRMKMDVFVAGIKYMVGCHALPINSNHPAASNCYTSRIDDIFAERVKREWKIFCKIHRLCYYAETERVTPACPAK